MPHVESRENSNTRCKSVRIDDEVPEDITAYFGHPLNSSVIDGSNALWHEYKNLPAFDQRSPDKTDEQSSKGESEDDDGDCDMLTALKFSKEKDSLEPFLSLSNKEKEEEFDSLVNNAQFLGDGDSQEADYSLSNCRIEFRSEELENVTSHTLHSVTEAGTPEVTDLDTEFTETHNELLDLVAESMRQGGMEELTKIVSQESAACSAESPTTDVASSPSQSLETSPESYDEQLHHSSPKTFHSTISSQAEASLNNDLSHASSTVKREVLSPKDIRGCPDQPPRHAPAQSLLRLQEPSKQTPNFLPPTMPQFMPVQIVQTSSGPMQVQPFIHNGQFGITQVSPCPPAANAGPMQPLTRPMQGAWAPGYYPFPPMPYRMQAVTNGENPRAPYYPQQEFFMLQPPYPTLGQPPMAAPGETIRAPYQPVYTSPVCQQLLQQQKAQINNNNSINNVKPAAHQAKTLSADNKIPGDQMHVVNGAAASTHLKSPDSGFGDHYTDIPPSSAESEPVSASNPGSPTESFSQGTKRRRSSVCLYSRSISASKTLSNNSQALPVNFVKRDDDRTGYTCTLEAATSCGARLEEDRMTYLNKGQYYNLVLENTLPPPIKKGSFVKTVILLSFRDDQSHEGEMKYWEFWYSRQSEDCQRAIDLDIKNSEGIIDNTFENTGVNALAFAWDPHEPVKAQIAVHCLSTDFSNQKGVKGLPLHIQVDIYDDVHSTTKCPIHRSYAQIKIFCDKGAERKARDEERKKEKEKTKPFDTSGSKLITELYHPSSDKTEFYSMVDLISEPLIYIAPPPDNFDDYHFKEATSTANSLSGDSLPSFLESDLLGIAPVSKKTKRMQVEASINSGILVYVREAHESVFTALMVTTCSLEGLAEAIQEKYNYAADIHMIYKRTSRGILVKMDDNMVKHIGHESMHVIDIQKLGDKSYDITLVETDL